MKKKIIALLLVVAMLGVAVISGTLAYFTDSEEAVNVFTVGDIDITLNEISKVLTKKGGEEILDKIKQNEFGGWEYNNIMPTNYLQKEVTVTNNENPAYVRVVVVLNNGGLINKAIDVWYENDGISEYVVDGQTYTDDEYIQYMYNKVFDGWGLRYNKYDDNGKFLGMRISLYDAPDAEEILHVDSVKTTKPGDINHFAYSNWFMTQAEKDGMAANPNGYTKVCLGQGYYDKAMNEYEIMYTYYLKMDEGDSVTLFDGLLCPAEFTKEQAKMFENLQIEVYADAIQAEGFEAPEGSTEVEKDTAIAAFEALELAHPLKSMRASIAPKTVFNAADLKNALAQGGDITLAADVTLPKDTQIVIPEGVTATLNLNGKTVIGGNYNLENNEKGYIFANYGNLTIIGDENTVISANGLQDGYGVIYNKGNLTLKGGTYTGSVWGGTSDYPAYTIRNHGNMTVEADTKIHGTFGCVSNPGGTLTINGGTYTNEDLPGFTKYLVSVWSNGEIIINGGDFVWTSSDANSMGAPIVGAWEGGHITINGGTFDGDQGAMGYSSAAVSIKGGTFKNAAKNVFQNSNGINVLLAPGYKTTENADGSWTVSRITTQVAAPTDPEDEVANGAALLDAITAAAENSVVELPAGEFKMPSVTGSKEFTISGTKDTVIDITLGAYMDSATVSFEGVTIKGSTGKANGNGSDYAALYTPNVTYTNCTFDGPFRIGRDGATFINCTFTNLGNDYVWAYGNDATFIGCTFESEGKALLLYSDGGNEVSKVVVKDCTFTATKQAFAGAISNQCCAAIEIQNYGNGVDLTTSGNTFDANFSGEWRIKTYHAGNPAVIVNGTEYTQTALDGTLLTVVGGMVQ